MLNEVNVQVIVSNYTEILLKSFQRLLDYLVLVFLKKQNKKIDVSSLE